MMIAIDWNSGEGLAFPEELDSIAAEIAEQVNHGNDNDWWEDSERYCELAVRQVLWNPKLIHDIYNMYIALGFIESPAAPAQTSANAKAEG